MGAVGTWIVVRILGGGGGGTGIAKNNNMDQEMGMRWWTGILLLFSGGTFLYVAMHTMQDTSSAALAEDTSGFGNGYLDGYRRGSESRPSNHKEGRSFKLVAAAVGGMLLPLITQIGHAH